ncbi:MAG: HEPN domain-containing protein [bacterium]|nr:HEPN domain-containing protein [bacterium]
MKDHTLLLLEKAEHSIRAARILLEADEPDFATSRAYYAMFYVAEALLFERDLAFSKHTAVQAAYGKEFARTALLDPKFHRWLLNAFDARLRGDYQVGSTVTEEDVETALGQAQEFLVAAREFLEEDSGGTPEDAPLAPEG